MDNKQRINTKVKSALDGTVALGVNKTLKIQRYSKSEKRNFFYAYMLCLIPVAHFLVFWLYVNFSSIAIAFTGGIEGADPSFQYFEAVINSLFNGQVGSNGFVMAESLGRSVFLWFFSNLVCFPISLVTVYILTCKIRGHFFYRLCEIIPSLLGSVIWSIVMRQILSYNGPLVALSNSLGIELPKTIVRNGFLAEVTTAFPSLLVITFMGSIVANSPIMTGAYSRIQDELLESAELDGAGFWRQFLTIAIPSVWPTITTTMIFNLAGFFTADCGVFLYTNGTGEPGCSTIGFELFYMQNQLASGGGSYGYPAAFGLILSLITFPICILGRWGLERLCDTIES